LEEEPLFCCDQLKLETQNFPKPAPAQAQVG